MKQELIANAYISIEVDESALGSLQKSIIGILRVLGVEGTLAQRPHVSIAYTMGEITLSDLEQIIEDIAEAPFIIESIGINIIPGQTFNCDYISLAIKANDDFLYAKEFVASNCEVQTKFNGQDFIAHISLITIDKGLESVHEELSRVIEIHSQENIGGIRLKGKSISVFNSDRALLIQKNL